MEEEGKERWARVAKLLGGRRSGKQCRNRWYNVLDPELVDVSDASARSSLCEYSLCVRQSSLCVHSFFLFATSSLFELCFVSVQNASLLVASSLLDIFSFPSLDLCIASLRNYVGSSTESVANSVGDRIDWRD